MLSDEVGENFFGRGFSKTSGNDNTSYSWVRTDYFLSLSKEFLGLVVGGNFGNKYGYSGGKKGTTFEDNQMEQREGQKIGE